MDASLLAMLAALALADSLNPFSIGAQAYLLSTSRPFGRSLAFLLATATTYSAGGLLLLYGFDAGRDEVMGWLSERAKASVQIAFGVALIGFAWWSWARGQQGKPLTLPKSLGVAAAFSFGFVSTLSDLPTALPLVVAAERITAASMGGATEITLMGLYVLVYIAPLLALVAIRAGLAQQSDRLFQLLQSWIDWAFRVLLPPLVALAGVALSLGGAVQLHSLRDYVLPCRGLT